MIKNISIESPAFLAVLLVLPLLWFLVREYKSYRKKGVKAFGGMMQIEGQGGMLPKTYWAFLVGVFLLAIAATNPRLQGKPITITRKGGDVIFALDVSKSMLAQDVKPSRLERAKLLCLNLLQDFDNQRVAVVVFAGNAYVTMPFSTNYSSVANFIDEANPGQVSAQGSDYRELVETLIEFFGVDKSAEKGVVVLSDGENHSELKSSDVKKANEAGLVFFTVGVGKTKGVPIPDGRGYLQDRSGKKVITKLHKKSLKKLAGKHGKYYSLSQADDLLRDIRRLRESNFSDLKSYEYHSLFQWFLLPAIVFLLLPFWKPKGAAKSWAKLSIIILILTTLGGEGLAQDSHQKLLKGDSAFKKQKYEDAAKWYGEVAEQAPENTQALYNSGVAEAEANKKKEALEFFAKAAEVADNQQDKASALYNAGTLLLSEKDQLDTSIELLKDALRNSPKDLDIRKNLAKAIQLKRQQQKQKQKQNEQNNQQKQKQNNQDNQQKQQNNDKQQKENQQQNQQQNQQDQNKQKQDPQDQNKQKQQQNKQDNQNQPQNKDPQSKKQQQNKDPKRFDDNHQKNDGQKPISIKKQKALQKLKMIDARERSVRKKMQKLKGKNAKHSGKNW